jgi:hypothetical protein
VNIKSAIVENLRMGLWYRKQGSLSRAEKAMILFKIDLRREGKVLEVPKGDAELGFNRARMVAP